METRANYLMIGGVTLAAIVSIFIFVYWLVQDSVGQKFNYYDILFQDAVAGLNNGGDVLYQGINVGQVTNIRVDDADPSRVRVTVRVQDRDDFEIRTSSEASLQMQGITGVAFVQITDSGGGGDVLPKRGAGELPFPEIQSQRSYLQAIFESAPQVVAEVQGTLEEIQLLIGGENREIITQILRDVQTTTGTIAARQNEIDSTIMSLTEFAASLGEVSDTLVQMSEDVASIADTADELLDEDVRETIASVNETAQAFTLLATDADRILRRNEAAIESFTNQGLSQLGYMVTESRSLIATLDRVAQHFESDPGGFLFGGGQTTNEVNVPD